MKSLAYSLAFFLILGFAAGQTGTKTMADFQAAAHWFHYDSKLPSIFTTKSLNSSTAALCTT
jgi:hypothetical protein